jgi:hypothetical protein
VSALSDVQICSLALDAAGTRSTIASLQENSKEARACSRQYGPSLAAVLQAAHWNFARKQAGLTLLLDGTKTPPDVVPQPWLYEYAYPDDCVQGRYDSCRSCNRTRRSVAGSSSLPYAMGAPVRFLVSSDDDDRRQPDQGHPHEPAERDQLVYTRLLTNTGLFDDQFVQAFVFYLAHRSVDPAFWR